MSKVISKFLVCAFAPSDGSPPWTRVLSAEIVKAEAVQAVKVDILRRRLICEVFNLSDAKNIAALLIAGRMLVTAAESDDSAATAPAEDGEAKWDHIARMSALGHSSGGFAASVEGLVGK